MKSNNSNSSMEIKLNDLYNHLLASEGLIDRLYHLFKSKNTQMSINMKDFVTILSISLQFAINEILSSVCDRAITISFATTKEIVRKDFFFEKDEKIVNAAQSDDKSL